MEIDVLRQGGTLLKQHGFHHAYEVQGCIQHNADICACRLPLTWPLEVSGPVLTVKITVTQAANPATLRHVVKLYRVAMECTCVRHQAA